MRLGLVGKKCGMTRIFSPEGDSVPVTVLHIEPNRVVQVKTDEADGYSAIQVTTGSKKSSKVSKPLAGHYAKANVAPGIGAWEFRMSQADIDARELKPGAELTVALFEPGQLVDVQAKTKGKGFAGVIKRHHFHAQDMTHGNSLSHRVPGSIGQRQTPGRVMKGKKMAGHLGDVPRTIQKQEIVRVDAEKNLLLIRGAVPGAPGGIVIVMPTVKQKRTKE